MMNKLLHLNPPSMITRNPMNRSPLRHGFPLISCVLACLALSPASRALSPPPDGGYPNGTTAEGTQALFSLTSGADNTATGYQALYSNRTGDGNTANGSQTLFSNTTGLANTATGLLALYHNTTGNDNTATGLQALVHNTTGSDNTATGA